MLTCMASPRPGTFDGERHRANPLHHRQRHVERRARHRHQEFLAAPATERVRGSQRGTRQPRELAQHLVAAGMAAAVVDGLEVIEIDERDGQRLARAHRTLQRRLDQLRRMASVRQPGQ
jgi:hypothetical protein